MRSVETTAKTRQEAIQKALEELGAELHEVQIEILDEGSRGIFGIGARDVKVKLTLEKGVPTRRRKERQRPERAERAERGQRGERGERERGRGGRRGGRQDGGRRPERAQKERGPKPRRQEKPETPQAQPQKTEAPPAAPVSESRRQEATALLGEIIEKMGMPAQVSNSLTEDGRARINIESPDSAILIGRKGRNLQALQYLLNRMMRPVEGETGERFVVDVENYLERRRESLEEMAQHLAERAKETGRDVRVKPLSAQERRFVHLALQDDPEVRTFSLGSSSVRTVVISPKSGSRPGGRDGGGRPRRRGGGRRNGRGRSDRSSEPAGVMSEDDERGGDEEMENGDAQES